MAEEKNEPKETSQAAPASWKVIVAFILDVLISFIGLGYIIAALTGGITEEGFSLSGGPAFLLFAGVILYFVLMNKYAGGTLGKMILGIKKK